MRVLVLLTTLVAAGCGSSPTSPTVVPASDFAAQFDALWTTFDREYSYFDYKHIDWNALRDQYRPRALAAADQAGVIAVLREMLGHLRDLHVVLIGPGGARVPTFEPQEFVNWNRQVWDQYLRRANWTQGQTDWGHGVLDGVPYVVVGGWGGQSIRIADFDAAFERYRTAPVLIVDVRMNGGGDDSVAFDVAGRFVTRTIVTGYTQSRNGPSHSDFTPLRPRTVSPRGAWQYGGRVLLLIGRQSASSNESFIEAMRQLPNVTLAGDRTAGASANPGTFQLSGGWSYTVSRWIEYTADLQVIQDVGIAPAAFVPASPADFAQGRDPVLDWAIAAARSS